MGKKSRRDRGVGVAAKEKAPEACGRQELTYFAAGFVALGVFLVLVSKSPVQLYELDMGNEEQMREVFYSGNPWLVLCTTIDPTAVSSKGVPRVEPQDDEEHQKRRAKEKPVDMTPLQLAELMHAVGKHAARLPADERFSVGFADCEQPLPSGLSVFRRFKVRKRIGHMAFSVANGEKPKLLPAEFLSDYSTSGVRQLFRYMYVSSQVQPMMVEETSDYFACLSRKRCLLMFIKGDLTEAQEDEMTQLSRWNRLVKPGLVDLSKTDVDFKHPAVRITGRVSKKRVPLVYLEKVPLLSKKDRKKEEDKTKTEKKKKKKKKKHEIRASVYKGDFTARSITNWIKQQQQYKPQFVLPETPSVGKRKASAEETAAKAKRKQKRKKKQRDL